MVIWIAYLCWGIDDVEVAVLSEEFEFDLGPTMDSSEGFPEVVVVVSLDPKTSNVHTDESWKEIIIFF